MADAQIVARRVMTNHREEAERISNELVSQFTFLKQIHLQAWRRDGQELVDWMKREAEDMAKAERDVAITKVTGGSVAIAGGVLTGVGVVASIFTFGLAAPLVVAGVATCGAGTATSTGGDIAKNSILHMKTCEIKCRCKGFEERTKGILSTLLQMCQSMGKLSTMCQEASSIKMEASVIEIILRSGSSATLLKNLGIDVSKIAIVICDIAQLQNLGVIFGADFLTLAGGSIVESSLAASSALIGAGVGAVVGIGFGIWNVVDAHGTLQKGGSHSFLIRDNASKINNTIKEIDKALCLVGL